MELDASTLTWSIPMPKLAKHSEAPLTPKGVKALRQRQLGKPRYGSVSKPFGPGSAPFPKTPKTLKRIFTEIAGGRLLRDICTEAWAPSMSVFYRWVWSDPELKARYELAKKIRVETLQDQIFELSESGDIGRLAYQLKARKWLHARFAQCVHGED